MTPEGVLDISRDAIWVLLKIAAPVMLVALFVGLLIALFQALTQIQEMTLTFVPKILAIFVSLLVMMPYILDEMLVFSERIGERIIEVGGTDDSS